MRTPRAEPGAGSQAATPGLIFARAARARRQRPALDYPTIVRAALRIADADGLAALSMRRIAVALGAGTMSLYRYLSSKEDLLDLMLDAAFAEIPLPERSGADWRGELRALARGVRRVLKRHHWLGPLLTSRPPLGPHYLRWFEASLAALTARGVAIQRAVEAVGTLYAYVSGVVGYELGDAAARRRHGLSEARQRALVAPYLETLLASGRFPNLGRFLREAKARPTDAAFEFGLSCVLDGLERALAPEAARAAREPGAGARVRER